MDLQLLFTAERLQLNPLLVKGAARKGRFTVKSLDVGGYLTIDELEWDALRAFAKPTTVPEALRNLIIERKCPALHDFYELVIKAQGTGLLQTRPSPVKQLVPLTWKFNLHAGVACWLGVALVLSGILAISIWTPRLFDDTALQTVLALLTGYVGSAAAVSLGNVLGASVLHASGGDISRPRLSWSWLLPHFSIDLRDSLLVDARSQLGTQLVRPAPLGLLITALCIWWPQAALLPILLLGFMIRPCFGGVISRAISQSFGRPVLDTSRHLQFPANRNWSGLWRAARLQFDRPVIAARLAWGLFWIAGMTVLGVRAAGVPVSEVLFDRHFWKVFGVVFGIALALPAGVFACIAAMESLRRPIRALKKRQRDRQVRKRAVLQPVTMQTITSTLTISPVCQQIPVDRRRVLAEQLSVATFPPGTVLGDFDRPAPEIYLIVSGVVEVSRRTQKGRPQRVWQAIEGDIIGAEHLIAPRPLGWRLRARSPVIGLRVAREFFDKDIAAVLGAETVQALAHRVPFLRQNRLCRNWHPQAINRFAAISRMAYFSDGNHVLVEDRESQGLFFVYEGQAQVVRHNRRVSRLGLGGFIGEIGLLQNSASTASVIAEGPLTCLAIDKTVFFRFLTQNYEVGLEVERLSSQRLGKPVFPLQPGSFELLERSA